MKKFILILFCALGLNAFSQEAEPQPEENLDPKKAEQVEALKIAFITKELDLTGDEAQKFWPVYNDFIKELKVAKKESKDDVIAFEEKKVVVLKKYQDNFRKILGTEERVRKCFNAGPRFKAFIRQEWIRRRQGPGGPGAAPKFPRKPGGGNPPPARP